MQKFKEGDLIIKDGKTYFARIIGETETLFDEVEINGLAEGSQYMSGWRTYGISHSIIIGPPADCSTGQCQPKCFNTKTGRIERKNTDYEYPIIGSFKKFGSINIDLMTLSRYYPEMALRYTQGALNYIGDRIERTKPGYGTAAAGDTIVSEKTIPGSGFRTSETPVDQVIKMANAKSKKALKKVIKKAAPRKAVKKTTKRK